MASTNSTVPDASAHPPACELCQGHKHLACGGIMRVYLAPHWLCALFVVAGTGAGIFLDPWYLALAAAGIVWPLANADLRMLLFPVVLIGKLMGKQVNCPHCEPGAKVFRRE